ncbi:hypothetical protein BROUX41_006107 [Berkeleyomyces rouxiae]|uniref:uncharacterized protein n=1 Tax=Berkeleyomyces rouxiae TaxID=2035830 RepID=UPI003B77AA87
MESSLALLLLFFFTAPQACLQALAAHIPGRPAFGAVALPDAFAALQPRAGEVCARDQHDCGEINQPNLCCDATKYCFVKTDSSVGCCAETAACIVDPCKDTGYLCAMTSTISGTAVAHSGCCPRRCSTGSFLCPSATGSGAQNPPGCCPYGFTCQGDSGCAGPGLTITSDDASPTTPGATLADCASDQRPCANGANGCCPTSADCSVSANGDVLCAIPSTAASSPTPAGASPSSQSASLSAGAKAGIAIGAAAAAGMLGFVAYVFWRKRKDRKALMSEGVVSDSGHGAMTSSVQGQRNIYTGPNAGIGPWTDTGPGAGVGLLRAINARGVVGKPQHPDDIMEPVEIGVDMRESLLESGEERR